MVYMVSFRIYSIKRAKNITSQFLPTITERLIKLDPEIVDLRPLKEVQRQETRNHYLKKTKNKNSRSQSTKPEKSFRIILECTIF